MSYGNYGWLQTNIGRFTVVELTLIPQGFSVVAYGRAVADIDASWIGSTLLTNDGEVVASVRIDMTDTQRDVKGEHITLKVKYLIGDLP
jgi:hypothetical protein